MEPNESLGMALLAELRAALSEHEVRSELREDAACLAVDTRMPNVRLWVFVSFGSRYYSWDNADQQHPVSDIQGAARRIAAQASHSGDLADTAP